MGNILLVNNLAEELHFPERERAMPAPRGATGDPWSLFADQIYLSLLRILTGMLIITLGLWMFAGVVNMFWTFKGLLINGWTGLAEHIIINSLIMLALLEVIRTLQAYLKLGRVRVTFILDTALVVLIGELMGLWFKEYAPEKVLLGIAVIATLVGLRIVTAKFSPEN